jgi:centromeric protein E
MELVDPQALIQQYQNEIAELRALIREKGIDGASSSGARQESEPLYERLQELRSRILTSSNITEDNGENVRPLLSRGFSVADDRHDHLVQFD